MSYGIRKVWCWTFTQQTSFCLTSYVADVNYITHRRFSSTFISRSIDILLEFWRFCQSSEHHFPPCLHPELSTTWYDHSIVTYKFQYSWHVWTSPVQGCDCDSCMLLWHDIWRLRQRHLAARLKLCGQLYWATFFTTINFISALKKN